MDNTSWTIVTITSDYIGYLMRMMKKMKSEIVRDRQIERRHKIASLIRLRPMSMEELIKEIDYSKPTIIDDIKYLNSIGYNISYDSSMHVYRLEN